MHPYELMVILNPEVDDRTVQPTLDKFLAVVTAQGGKIDNVDVWGRRRLAYEIQKKSEGVYAVVNFTAEPATTAELERQLRLSESVMRTKVLRADEAVARIAKAAE
ncbi:MAG: 30S ribosomal protein S6 [Microbacteriaceae bacterium]